MTIKKLKEMIANLPDDMRIYADDSAYDMFGDDASEFVCLVTSSQVPGKAVLQKKTDIDVQEELSCMADLMIACCESDDVLYAEALERGFVPEDFPDPVETRRRMTEEYGLL